jgi:VCBS repeat-containing protein
MATWDIVNASTWQTTVEIASGVLVQITVQDNGAGGITFTLEVVDGYADLRAFFFNENADAGALTLGSDVDWGTSDITTSGKFTTEITSSLDGDALEKDANLNGTGITFENWVEFGSSGIGKDDISYVEFTVDGLTLEDLVDVDFGIRATSVGTTEATRTDSVKYVDEFEAPANQAPVAQDDLVSTDEDEPLNGDVLADNGSGADSDADGDTLTVILVDDVANGTLTLNADGTFEYIPDANFNGTDSFTYKLNDGTADSNVATVTINVASVNDEPVAVADEYNMLEDGSLTVNAASGVLANDSDPNDSPANALSATLVDGVDNGTLTLNADGSFTYTPNANFNGTDSFTYTVSDNGGTANGGDDTGNTVTVTINVASVNDEPVAVADEYNVNEDGSLNINAAGGVLANDSDPNDSPANTLSAALVSDVSNGTLSLNADGSFTYTPDANFNGTDSFTYQVSDNGGTANGGDDTGNTVTVTINVAAVNDAPVAGNDRWFVSDATTVVFPSAALLANDTDIENDSLSVTALSLDGTSWITDLNDSNPGSNSIELDTDRGSLSVSLTTGVITYTTDNNNASPGTSQFLTDAFYYRVSDGDLADEGQVNVWVVNIESGGGMDSVNLNNAPYSADAQSYSYIDLRNGDDQLTGSPGSDTFFGSGGNDIINVGVFGANDKIDGGGSTVSFDGTANTNLGDVLVFDGNLDLTSLLQDRITNIETLSMADSAGGDSLTLNVNDVIDLGNGTFDPAGGSGGGSIGNLYSNEDAIRVNGDAGDTLSIVGAGWYELPTTGPTPVTNVPTGYKLYVNDTSGTGADETAYILVQSQVNVNII